MVEREGEEANGSKVPYIIQLNPVPLLQCRYKAKSSQVIEAQGDHFMAVYSLLANKENGATSPQAQESKRHSWRHERDLMKQKFQCQTELTYRK